MANTCTKEQCAHYIANDHFHVYRHKFLWTISIATILAAFCFAYIAYSFNSAQSKIVEAHVCSIEKVLTLLEPAKMSKDSCYYVNEQFAKSVEAYMESSKDLLELQSTKIQSDFTVLSLWAGILMIVFLVFSIYSMFKTDEILRQSREGLKAIENTEKEAEDIVDSVEQKTNEEILKVTQKAIEEQEKIQSEASSTIDEVKKEILQMREGFSQDVTQKSDEFRTMYEGMMKKMEETSTQNTNLIQQLVATIRESNIEQKGDAQKEVSKPKAYNK